MYIHQISPLETRLDFIAPYILLIYAALQYTSLDDFEAPLHNENAAPSGPEPAPFI